ncbi:MAG: cell division protein ZapA, partial [Deltaproteobacteria bacterium]|nr:cell division protein ZapA [Deltaproteobacteria bacterium]
MAPTTAPSPSTWTCAEEGAMSGSIQRVRVAGRVLSVRAHSGEEHLNAVVREVNERVEQVSHVIPDSTESLLFVLLSVTDELLRTQERLLALQDGAQERVGSILGALEAFERRYAGLGAAGAAG